SGFSIFVKYNLLLINSLSVLARISTDINSVKYTSGLAQESITWRNTLSVTSFIGAKTKKGFLNESHIIENEN
ncbi:MAG: hypothetical protein WAU72_03310, partial [Acidimicrobiia bacterium]